MSPSAEYSSGWSCGSVSPSGCVFGVKIQRAGLAGALYCAWLVVAVVGGVLRERARFVAEPRISSAFVRDFALLPAQMVRGHVRTPSRSRGGPAAGAAGAAGAAALCVSCVSCPAFFYRCDSAACFQWESSGCVRTRSMRPADPA